ncbi:MAG TPA: hypothetical protein VKP60_00535, partial [Magnetospirillaceae bacterium]|nr:hypothetical protein [Magnetospirillaceae bacterium]
MFPLDLRSAFLLASVVDAVFALSILLLWRRDRHVYLPAWSGGYACLATAQLLIGGRTYIPDLLSVVAANGLVVLGNLALYFGTSAFY